MLRRPPEGPHDLIDHIFLWKVLARCGVPDENNIVFPQFHEGLKNCVRWDDREPLDGFSIPPTRVPPEMGAGTASIERYFHSNAYD